MSKPILEVGKHYFNIGTQRVITMQGYIQLAKNNGVSSDATQKCIKSVINKMIQG